MGFPHLMLPAHRKHPKGWLDGEEATLSLTLSCVLDFFSCLLAPFFVGFPSLFLLNFSLGSSLYWLTVREELNCGPQGNLLILRLRASLARIAFFLNSFWAHPCNPNMKLKSLFTSTISLMSRIKELNSFTQSLTKPICFSSFIHSLPI